MLTVQGRIVFHVSVFKAEPEQIRWIVFGREGGQNMPLVLEHYRVHAHPAAPHLSVPEQKRWGPSSGAEQSICHLPGKWPASKDQCGFLLPPGGYFFLSFSSVQSPNTHTHFIKHLQIL